jgi:hypothetical protein
VPDNESPIENGTQNNHRSGRSQRRKKGLEVGRLVEHILPVVPAIDHMVDQAITDRSQGSRHGALDSTTTVIGQLNSSDPFSQPSSIATYNRRAAVLQFACVIAAMGFSLPKVAW